MSNMSNTRNKTQLSLTEGNLIPTLIRFALPFLGATFLQLCYGIADMIVIGQFSDAAGIAAVNNSGQVMQMVTSLICGIATGGSVLIGQYIGAKRTRDAGKTIGNMILLFAAVAILLTGLLVCCCGTIVNWLKVPAEAVEPAIAYLKICGFGTVFITGYNAVACILRGLGDSKRPMYFIAISCVLNVIGDLILVAGFHMGAAGAAIATAGAQAISFGTALVYLSRHGIGVPIVMEPDGKRMFQVLKIGTPVALQDFLVCLSFIIITVVVNTIGLAEAAAVGVVERIIMTAMSVSGAFMSTLSVFAAQNIGAEQPDRARKGTWTGIVISLAFSVIPFLAIELVPHILMGIFTGDSDVVYQGILYLRFYGIDVLLVCVVFCMNGLFSGCGHTGFVMLNSMLATFLCRIPIVILMSVLPGTTMLHIGIASPIASSIQIGIQLIYYRTGKWKKPVISRKEEKIEL